MSYKYTAIIIEPRQHKALEFVINNFINNLDYNDWCFVILYGNLNKDYVFDIILNKINILKENNHNTNDSCNNKISLYNMGIDNITIDDYNNLLKSKDFYNFIKTEKFLIFQTDTIILTEHKHLINNFLEYDYVGAPWNIFMFENPMGGGVGNGGLSFRSKKHMLEILDKVQISSANEDIYFSLQDIISLNKPSYEKAKEFSIETVFSPVSFGVHKIWKYQRYMNMDINGWEYLINRYPEIKTITELNDYTN